MKGFTAELTTYKGVRQGCARALPFFASFIALMLSLAAEKFYADDGHAYFVFRDLDFDKVFVTLAKFSILERLGRSVGKSVTVAQWRGLQQTVTGPQALCKKSSIILFWVSPPDTTTYEIPIPEKDEYFGVHVGCKHTFGTRCSADCLSILTQAEEAVVQQNSPHVGQKLSPWHLCVFPQRHMEWSSAHVQCSSKFFLSLMRQVAGDQSFWTHHKPFTF